MKILQRIWDDIRRGENIDLYISVVFAIVIATLNVVGIASEKLLAPVTLSVLGLLAYSLLGNRHFLKEELQKINATNAFSLKSRHEFPTIEKAGETASEIVIVGIALISAVIPHLNFYEQKMREGKKIRFLLLNPKSTALATWNKTGKIPNIKGNIEQTLESLALLIQMEKTTKGKCDVRLSDAFLSFSATAFDPEKDAGILFVEIPGYKKTTSERPHFVLESGKDKKWFEYFRSQYEQLWQDSEPWKPKI